MTALLTGAVAALAFGLSFEEGLLIGAVLSPTDPAILIPLFVASRLRLRVAQTVIAESAFNDPTGAVLALAVAGSLLSGEGGVGGPASEFLVAARDQLARRRARGRAAVGDDLEQAHRDPARLRPDRRARRRGGELRVAGLRRRQRLPRRVPAGLIVGNMELLGLVMHSHNEDELRIASRTLAEVVTIFIFLVVGAALPFATLADNWAPSLAVVGVLLLVARPVAVLACTLPDRRARWTRPELAFLCWTRETGVVPAALVGVLAGLGAPNVDLMAGVVALAIVATLLLQAAPGAVARAPPRAARPRAYRSRLTASTVPLFASTRTVVSFV